MSIDRPLFQALLCPNNNIYYFFLSAWAGKMNQILQSDSFRERAEFSDLDRGQRNVNNKKFVMGF